MSFPVYVRFGSAALHPHVVFEVLAYVVGLLWLRHERRRLGDVVDARTRWWVVGAALIGGFIGGRLLYMLEDPIELASRWSDPSYALGGKTVVGGLIGAVAAVEWIKRRRGVTVATGDLLVLPLVAGMILGRIGCFLTGLADQTYGGATSLPWGVDFGDGILRHPTQLYEVLFLILLAVLLVALSRRFSMPGDRFKLFLLSYMAFRLAVDFLKPAVRAGGLSAIQWACLAVIAYYLLHVKRLAAEVRRG